MDNHGDVLGAVFGRCPDWNKSMSALGRSSQDVHSEMMRNSSA